MKKILSVLLAFAMVFSAVLPVVAEKTDKANHNHSGEILEDLGLLKGDGEGNLGLDANLKKQHMVVMISRLYGEGEKASKFDGVNKFKDLKPKHRQDIPFITWASSKGLIKGKPDGTFGIDEEVTVQEYQTVLLRALGYEKDANDWEIVPKLSDAYGLMKNTDVKPSAKMNRGVMATMTVNALRQEKNGKTITLADFLDVEIPDEFKVNASAKVENNNVVFEGETNVSEKLWVQITPVSSSIEMDERLSPVPVDSEGDFFYEVKDLEVGEYKYRYKYGQQYTEFESFEITMLPFELKDVSAKNLKAIHLEFTQPVDKTITSLKSNYTTSAGPIKNIRFEDNDKKIVLVLSGTMTQQMNYTISAMKIMSKSGEEESLKEFEFEAFDNIPPEVESISQLGDKGIRIYFSEPLKKANTNDFKIDGKKFNGNATLDDNIVTLKYFSSDYELSKGDHTLKVSSVEDYAGYKPMDTEHDFSIEKDNTAPKIVDASATLNTVTIEFDEDIDPISEKVKSIYIVNGSSKMYPKTISIKGRKAIAEFKSSLSTNKNTIHARVLDYSGNRSDDSVNVVPVIDTTSPEVISYKVSDDGKTITVYYSKHVKGNNRKNYKILNEDERTVNIRSIQGSGIEYNLNLYSPLPVGTNTLTIEGVKDTTTLENTMIAFETEIDMKDVESPRLVNHSGFGNRIVLRFSKVMDMGSLTDPENYIITFKGNQIYMPTNSLFTPSDDGKSVTILLPETINGNKVMIGSKDNISSLDIRGLKDISGNSTNPLMINIKFDGTASGKAKATDYYPEKPGRQGVLVESNLIKVRFNLPIIQASEDDFKLKGREIESVVVDGSDEVLIYLDDKDATSIGDGSLTIVEKNNMGTTIETGVESSTILLYDEIAPRIENDTYELNVRGNQIEIPFTEELEDAGAALYKRDIEVVRLEDNEILSTDDYTSSLKSSDKSILIVTIDKRDITSGYSIRLAGEYGRDDLSYIRDKDGNPAIESDIYFTSRDINKR